MKKYYLLLLLLLFGSQILSAQTTEAFENETHNSTTFSEGGITFNITSQQSYFRVQGNYPNTGWNGTAKDNKYIDNSNYTSSSQGVQLTISTANGAAITLKSLWIYVSTSGLNLSPIGTLTITGKREGSTVYTVSKNNPFNPSASVNNGFTLFDMATLGGQDNSNVVIDQYVIATDMGIGYLSVDAMKFQCAPVAVTNTSQTNVSCFGGTNGAASVTVGPSGTLSYDWAPGNPAGDGTASVTGLTAGTWTCTITNACGSTNTATFNITGPAAALSATTGQTNVNCYGNASGGASVNPEGGTAPYTYLWATGETTASISNKPIGNYSVTITDNKGCTINKSFTIIQPAAALSATTGQTNVLCNGAATGGASVSPSGGTSPYTYLWSNGQTASSISSVTSGNYSVTITDFNGCTLAKSFTISQPAGPMTATTLQTDILCYGDNTGSAGVTVSGGTPGYTYLWNNGATAASISNLTSGNYSVTITDANGCNLIKNFTITAPAAALSGTTSQTNILCYGSTGSATVAVSGGTQAYSYSWSPFGGNAATANNLTAGDYSVLVTDANGCTLTKNYTITAPASPLSAVTSQTATCFGGSTGTAGVSVSGGTAPYTYLWSTGDQTADITGLSANAYSVTITDANGCTHTENITIGGSAAAINTTITPTWPLCNGDANGSATVAVTGGVAPYTYLWSNGGQTDAISGLTAGNYSVIVTDANQCSATESFTLYEPGVVSINTVYVNSNICHGGTTGSINIYSMNGGTWPFTYSWSNGATGANLYNLSAGNYSVIITDANGCTTGDSYTITEPATGVTATFTQTDVACNGASNGSVTIEPIGGIAPYDYQIFPSGAYGNNPTIAGLAAGDYSVLVRDAYNCNTTIEFTINQPDAVNATIATTASACGGWPGGTAAVTVTGGVAPYTYTWAPYTFDAAATASGMPARDDYTVTVTDANFCSVTIPFVIEDAGTCGITTTWNGSSWSNGMPSCESYAVVMEGDYNSAENGAFYACSLTVNSGNVVINSGDTINLTNEVTVNGGTLTFESDASLIQYNNVANSGEITYKRNSNALYNLDYTIWSSPVSGSQTLKSFSPQTLDNRFFVYNTALNAYSNYLSASGVFGGNPDAETFITAKGYLIRMPDGISDTVPVTYEGEFHGTPNNGDISIPLNTEGNRYNAVGNPYPSGLRLLNFLQDNQQNLDNGTVYFWRKRNGTTDTTYTTMSLAGAVDGCGDCGGEGGEGGGEGNSSYTFAIKPGQGFFVKAAVSATALTFNNYMRWNLNNSQFYKMADTTPAVADSKYWLNITSEANDFGQMAVAYMEGTTLNLDYGYDGRLLNDGAVALYTLAQDTKLSIQARDVFNVQDEVALGYKATVAGSFTISLHKFTGLFNEGQDIYLVDLLEGITRDLKNEGSYTFTTEAGTFTDRFKIVYQPALGIDPHTFNTQSIIAYKVENGIIVSSSTAIIKAIAVYDIHGRILYKDDKVNAAESTITGLAIQEQMIIVQVTTTEGYKTSKKIIY